ncbi:MAG TPA: DUF3995 domain-containing protein [Pyrinomonadaceae bacterium]|nr:DUF3995 domain-containing protein [Pyrinomonadaceae bacterium]
MVRILGIVLAVIFALLSFLHLYWAAGGRFGRGAAIPSVGGARVLRPSPVGTALVAMALFAAMLVVLGRLKLVGAVFPRWIFYWGTWAISLLFLLRAIGDFRYVGFFKSVSGTDFAHWDTILFSPLCLFIAVAAFFLSYYEA